ncbi:uncharacterized protein PHALS_09818 [Plasmopara halstedii]|uniref:Uncharacterized protein n=1 Tax=Plasmopara halstedii TaxID=4781 RepID=A0A0P1AET3_PLAHL|nr:uncharacterized protein PHALS_09818 [Plasmopara halstedii]CEG39578.1 hypothetical protein PHALS_09818 [Plasmopara halstedii]|eukprot:XP_024575947.1 hypothetical protein PHALS_09818 [Plasmopara halstedii]
MRFSSADRSAGRCSISFSYFCKSPISEVIAASPEIPIPSVLATPSGKSRSNTLVEASAARPAFVDSASVKLTLFYLPFSRPTTVHFVPSYAANISVNTHIIQSMSIGHLFYKVFIVALSLFVGIATYVYVRDDLHSIRASKANSTSIHEERMKGQEYSKAMIDDGNKSEIFPILQMGLPTVKDAELVKGVEHQLPEAVAAEASTSVSGRDLLEGVASTAQHTTHDPTDVSSRN